MQKELSILLVTFLVSVAVFSQTDDRIIIRVNDQGITTEEFVRLYSKNLLPNEKPDFDEYLDQFLIFKLKVTQAIEEELDTLTSFKKELEGYRNQLAEAYLTDSEARDEILRNAFSRLNHEINALHILVECGVEANPTDTLLAYKKALEVRVRLLEGEPFEQVAMAVSDHPSVVSNGGNLGWFTALQMITPFEEAAYSMKPGEISMPVRTPYGYHIIKVNDRRPSQGRIKVAHIMKALPTGASKDSWQRIENEIQRVHDQIMAGESFSELAEKESDHRESASKGGELEWFGAGDIVHEFTNAAFGLLRDGDISDPVRTPFGWHIIKRLERKPLGSFEENRDRLASRLSESYLNSIAKNAMVEKLKLEYSFKTDSVKLKWFYDNTDSMLIEGKNKFGKGRIPQGSLFIFTGDSLDCTEFADVIETNFEAINSENSYSIINQLFENRVADMLLKYEDSQLEQKYPDFRFLIKEFHDGMLLFEINSREVWNRPYTDSTGLYNYYLKNNNNYLGKPSADLKIYSCKLPCNLKTLNRLVGRHGSKSNGDSRILNRYIDENDTTLTITGGRFYKGDNLEIDVFIDKKGTRRMEWNNMESVILVSKVYKPEPRNFEDVRQEVINDYQEFLEESWIAQLKKKYSVWVNEEILREVRSKLNEEK